MTNLFLVERQWQVHDFISRGISGEAQWVAIGPSAMWALDKEGIPYRIPEDFYAADEMETGCRETHRKVAWLCQQLDDRLLAQHHELQDWGIRPFFFNIYSLTVLFDSVVSRIFQMKAILRAFPGAGVIVHRQPLSPRDPFYPPFCFGDTLWAEILALPGWEANVEFMSPGNGKHRPGKPPGSGARGVKNLLLKRFILRNLASSLRARDWPGLADTFRQAAGGTLLLYGGSFEWGYVMPCLREQGYRVLLTSDHYFQSSGGLPAEGTGRLDLKAGPDIIACFEYAGIPFYPLLSGPIGWIWENAPAISREVMNKMRRLASKYDLKALLVSTSATMVSHLVARSARHLDLPVIGWQHGFVGGRNNNLQLNEYNDLMTTDRFFTYGEGVSAAYRPFTSQLPGEVVAIGAASLDRISRQFTATAGNRDGIPPTKRLLYVTAAYYENTWYYGFSPPWSDRTLYCGQALIVNYLQSLAGQPQKGLDITIKLHPLAGPEDPPWLADLADTPQIRVVKAAPTFVQLLAKNDVIIIDSPTTTALQAAATNKPMFVTRLIGYPDAARQLLARRAVCTDEVGELVKKLDRFLSTGRYEADVNNREFLRAYGTHLDDGQSAGRAVTGVFQAIGRTRAGG